MKFVRIRRLLLRGAVALAAVVAVGSFSRSTPHSSKVYAATIGDELDNSALTVGKSSSGINTVLRDSQPWSMYQIPGVSNNRERKPNEGSFVKWAYNGWGASGTPLATSLSGSSPNVQQVTSDWKSGKTESPVSINFLSKDAKGNPGYFAVNYVDNDELLDFGSDSAAPTTTKDWALQQATADDSKKIFNPYGVVSKMISSDGTSTGAPVLDSAHNQSFSGGYLQATGNVPISAAVANLSSLIDATMAGDWAVMVRVKVAKGMDAKALAASVDWDKSYYYLTVQSINVPLTSIAINLNFPLQFDHHVYLDPNDSQSFFLKVKGVPFWTKAVSSNSDPDSKDSTIQLQLQDGNADYVDYLNNRQITGGTDGHATTLDKLLNSDGSSSTQTNLNDADLITTNKDGSIQPKFPTFQHYQGGFLSAAAGNPLWSAWGIQSQGDNAKSPLGNTGATGKMAMALNLLGDLSTVPSSRFANTGGFFNVFGNIIRGMGSYFGTNMFTGNAHINFSFDMSKYQATSSTDAQSLSNGRLPASPNANGTFNSTAGTDANDAIQITMYNSSDLVDPYSLIPASTSREDKANDADIRKYLHTDQSTPVNATTGGQAGMTPADYAVINAKTESDLDSLGQKYPTYTNFSSWTGAIMPYDRLHWKDDSTNAQDTTYTDTMHSSQKLQQTGTVSPDPTQDGILMNDGDSKGYNIIQRDDGTNDDLLHKYASSWAPVFKDNAKHQLRLAGEIWPQRYANVYQYYDYDSSGKATGVDIKPLYTSDTNKLNVKTSTAENIQVSADNGDKNITSSLNGKQWHYTGTMTSGGVGGMPLADATVDLSQSLKPQIDLEAGGLHIVNDNDLNNSGGVTDWLGYFRDPLMGGADMLSGKQTSLDGTTQKAKWYMMDTDTLSHNLNLNVGTQNAFANANLDDKYDKPLIDGITTPKDSKGNLTGDATYDFKMPTQASESRLYFNTITLKHDASVKTTQGYNLQPTVEGEADASYLVYRNPSPAPDNNIYTIDKYFNGSDDASDHPVVHFVKAPDGKNKLTYSVEGNVTLVKGKTASKDKTMTLLVPKIGSTFTIANFSSTSQGNSNNPDVTPVDSSTLPAGLANQYNAYKLVFPEAPDNFEYTYDYVASNATTVFPADYLNQGLTDILFNGSQLLAASNEIYFDSWKNVNLLSVPNLDFGKRTLPGTTGATYPLNGLSGTGKDQQVTDSEAATAAKSNAKLEVQDNLNNTSSWTVSGKLMAFNNQATNTNYDGFQINLGLPAVDTDGKSEGLPVPPASGPVTDAEKAYVNHEPLTMVSGGAYADLYKVSRLVEADAQATPLTRYYTNATLTVPANMQQAVTKGKYTATITYDVRDGTL